MAATAGPDIVDNGLVLALDAADLNSFKGEATINLISDPFALSGFPTPVTWSGYEGTVTRTSSLPFEDMYNVSSTWLQIDKTSSSNGRIAVLGVSGLQTGVDYCCSFYVYSNDTNLTSVNWLSDNGAVSTIQSYTSYTSSDRNTIKRIQTIFRSVSGSQVNVLRINATDPIGTRAFITGLQVEQKSYPTTVVNGTRGTTVATGGGWADLTGRGNNGEVLNGVRESNTNRGSLLFDGTDDYISIPDSTDWDFTSGFSIDLWVYVNSYDAGGVVFIHQQSGAASGGFELWVDTNNAVRLNKNGAVSILVSGNSFTLNTWNNVVCTHNGTAANIFMNATNIASSQSAALPDNVSGILRIGGYTTNNYDLNGRISTVKLYNRALTASEIQQNFNESRSRFGI